MAQRRDYWSRSQDRHGGRDHDDPYRTYGDDNDRDDARLSRRYGDDRARWGRDEDEDRGFANRRAYGQSRALTEGFRERNYGGAWEGGAGQAGFGYSESMSYGGIQGGQGSQGGYVGAPNGGGSQSNASWAQQTPPVPFYAQQQQSQPQSPYGGSPYGGQHGQPQRSVNQGPSQFGQNTYNPQYGQSGSQTGYAPSDPRGFAQASTQGTRTQDYNRWRDDQLGNYDAQYRIWRNEQARRLDDDYALLCRGFDDWRQQNQGAQPQADQRPTSGVDAGPTAQGASDTTGAGKSDKGSGSNTAKH